MDVRTGAVNGVAVYAETQGVTREDLVSGNLDLVKRIALHMTGRLPPTVQLDDLMQAGMIGLLEAAGQYDPVHGASFSTYAGIRIRGAILDEVRRNDWAPRSVYRKARQISEAVRTVEGRTKRDARDQEVAEVLDMRLADYHQLLKDASGYRLLSFDDVNGADQSLAETLPADGHAPEEGVLRDAFRETLAQAVDSLPERERLVMGLYYDEELNLREIGEVLGVTESRVSQIHSQAILRLRARMSEWRAEDVAG